MWMLDLFSSLGPTAEVVDRYALASARLKSLLTHSNSSTCRTRAAMILFYL